MRVRHGVRPETTAAMPPQEMQDARVRLNWTQEQLGEYLGYSMQTVRRWERGWGNIPRVVKLALDARLASEPAQAVPHEVVLAIPGRAKPKTLRARA